MNVPPTQWFRRVLIGLHLLVASLFCVLITVSVIKSVATMTPRRIPVAQAQSVDDCQKQAWLLWEGLERERQNWVLPELKTANNWMEYRADWMTQLEKLQKSCADSESQKLFKALRKLMGIYSKHMTAFVKDLTPALKPLQR
ncbi:MAG: hypothetical protein FWC28_06855 [Proteobacteria bacterium]|nr:hypothetical protein [Cystobacterineae bacterium]MCL2258636.1 hypothetical protein [Cystobacterineae bacterium]MCL2314949.1 hypothetical protein [Pseudomonadota bacterium]